MLYFSISDDMPKSLYAVNKKNRNNLFGCKHFIYSHKCHGCKAFQISFRSPFPHFSLLISYSHFSLFCLPSPPLYPFTLFWITLSTHPSLLLLVCLLFLSSSSSSSLLFKRQTAVDQCSTSSACRFHRMYYQILGSVCMCMLLLEVCVCVYARVCACACVRACVC